MGTQPILEDVRLVGERVLLRPLRPADAPVAYDLVHGRRAILRWLLWQGPASVADMDEWCRRWAWPELDGWNYHLAICAREDPELRFRGSIGPRFGGHPFVADLGYWLGEESWGQGYGSEAVFLCTHLCFRHLEARALTAEVFEGNAGSERVLQKNGFRREAGAHECRLPDGGRQLAWQFSLTRRGFERHVGTRRPVEEHVELRNPDAGRPPGDTVDPGARGG